MKQFPKRVIVGIIATLLIAPTIGACSNKAEPVAAPEAEEEVVVVEPEEDVAEEDERLPYEGSLGHLMGNMTSYRGEHLDGADFYNPLFSVTNPQGEEIFAQEERGQLVLGITDEDKDVPGAPAGALMLSSAYCTLWVPLESVEGFIQGDRITYDLTLANPDTPIWSRTLQTPVTEAEHVPGVDLEVGYGQFWCAWYDDYATSSEVSSYVLEDPDPVLQEVLDAVTQAKTIVLQENVDGAELVTSNGYTLRFGHEIS